MITITIPKNKYEILKKKARAYELLKKRAMRGGFFDTPPKKNSVHIIKAFRASGQYNEKFIKSVERGLGRSGYFKER